MDHTYLVANIAAGFTTKWTKRNILLCFSCSKLKLLKFLVHLFLLPASRYQSF